MPSQQQASTTPVARRDEYQTPDHVYRWAEGYWGKFDIDLAATPHNTKCDRFFARGMEGQDALEVPWRGIGKRGWCNPPYSNVTPFLELAIDAARETGFETIMLLPTPNGDARDGLIFEYAREIVFITGWWSDIPSRRRSGRLSFVDYRGIPATGNTRGSCLVQFAKETLGSSTEVHAIPRIMMERDAHERNW